MERVNGSGARPKVLILCTNSDEAGAPIHVEALLGGLVDDVEFHAVFGENGPVAERLRNRGVPVHVIETLRSQISPLRDIKALIALLAVVRLVKPHLIHAHSSKAGMLGRIAALMTQVPCIYTVHGWGWRGLNRSAARAVYLIEKILSFLPRTSFIYVCRDVITGARELGIPAEKGTIIYNGVVDHGVVQAPSGELCIMMTARVSSAKDHETLVRAFEHFSGGRLVLCGGGTQDLAFQTLLREWAPTRHSSISCLGQRSDARRLLGSAHVFVLSSNFEALPISIIEAMSAGKAIIATEVGGVSELVQDGISGILVPPKSVGDMIRALRALQDPEVRDSLGGAARQKYVERFTVNVMCEETLKRYCSNIK